VHLRWYIAALLFLSTVINYVDRQTLSVVAPILTKELDLSPVAYSRILSAFLIAYTAMYLGSGLLVDRFGTKWSLTGFMAWWSASNMAHAAVTGPFSLGAFRFLLGLGESGNFMAAFKAVSEWYAPKERAFVNGLVQAGASVGAIVAPPLVTWIALNYGWRVAFLATGSLGFFWLIPWLACYRRGAPANAAPVRRTPWLALLRYRQTWGLFLSRFFSDPVWWFYLFWLPKYLVEQRGFTVAEMGRLAWLPYVAGDAGAVLGGLCSDFLVRRGWTVLRARMAAMLPFALLMPLSIVVAYTPSTFVCMALICVITFAHMAWKTNLTTITNDVYPTEVIGSVAGLVAFGNGLGGTIFTSLTGWIVQQFGYPAVFVMMGCMHPVAYAVLRLLVRKPL